MKNGTTKFWIIVITVVGFTFVMCGNSTNGDPTSSGLPTPGSPPELPLTPSTYTVVFNGNGTGTMPSQNFTHGISHNLPNNGFTYSNYTFDGWAKSPNGPVEYSVGQTVTNLAAVGQTITLYAIWWDITLTLDPEEKGYFKYREVIYDSLTTAKVRSGGTLYFYSTTNDIVSAQSGWIGVGSPPGQTYAYRFDSLDTNDDGKTFKPDNAVASW